MSLRFVQQGLSMSLTHGYSRVTLGRMDHMEGSHDDSICALAMGLFVMQYTFNRVQASMDKDKAILNSYMVNTAFNARKSPNLDGKLIAPMPFYIPKTTVPTVGQNIHGNYMWLIR